MKCILMNKNIPVAEVNLDEDTAIILEVTEAFKLDFLPIGIDCREGTPDKKKLNEWWLGRAIPKNRFGLRGALEQMESKRKIIPRIVLP